MASATETLALLLSYLFLIFLWNLVSATTPSPCAFDPPHDPAKAIAVRCRNSTLDEIVQELPKKMQVKNVSLEEIDITNCDIGTLPNIFAIFSTQHILHRIRVVRSKVQIIGVNAFTGLELQLRYLDLSCNRLTEIPDAIKYLEILEVLDVRYNLIHHVNDEKAFFRSRRLRELYLGYNQLGVDVTPDIPQVSAIQVMPIKQSFRLPVTAEVFKLDNIAETLQHLDLSNNWLQVVPDKLLIHFPRLRTLDLSNNRLTDFPVSFFSGTSDLLMLNLNSNLLRSLSFDALPTSVKVFTFKNNPLQCDCKIMWLLKLARENSQILLQMPMCSTPFYLRDLTISNLNDGRLCNQFTNNTGTNQTVYVTDKDLVNFHLGLFQSFHLLTLEPQNNSLSVVWRVTQEFYDSKFSWSVIYRRFNDGIYSFKSKITLYDYKQTQPNWRPGEQIFTEIIQNLTAQEFYVVCIAAVENTVHYVHQNHCRGATPLRETTLISKARIPSSSSTTTTSTTTKKPQFQEVPQENVIPSTSTTIATSFISGSPNSPTAMTVTSAPMALKSDVNYSVSVTAGKRSINITWTVDHENDNSKASKNANGKSPLNLESLFHNPYYYWKVTYRECASDNYTIRITNELEQGAKSSDEFCYYEIQNLKSGTAYIVCFEMIPYEETQKNEQPDNLWKLSPISSQFVVISKHGYQIYCQEVRTREDRRFPAAEVATATAVSTSATAIVVALVCFFLPKRWCRKKKAASQNASTENKETSMYTPHSLRRWQLDPLNASILGDTPSHSLQTIYSLRASRESLLRNDSLRSNGHVSKVYVPPEIRQLDDAQNETVNVQEEKENGSNEKKETEINIEGNDESEKSKDEKKETVKKTRQNGCISLGDENIEIKTIGDSTESSNTEQEIRTNQIPRPQSIRKTSKTNSIQTQALVTNSSTDMNDNKLPKTVSESVENKVL